jgi:enoyl-CoA hydratase
VIRVRVEYDGDIAVWTLSRPEVRNALDRATFAALKAALHAAKTNRNLRAVILTGQGDAFASGGDLRELRSALTRSQAGRLADLGRLVCDGIARLQVPVIAALPGPALGGGAELALACDLRVADPRATLCFKHARMAVTTAWGVLPKLVATVGHGAATRLLLTGHEVDAHEALRLGLVDAVSQPGASAAAAAGWARDVVDMAPAAIAGLKGLLGDTLRTSPRQRARERERFVAAWTSADHREAVESFFARRAPRWQGR